MRVLSLRMQRYRAFRLNVGRFLQERGCYDIYSIRIQQYGTNTIKASSAFPLGHSRYSYILGLYRVRECIQSVFRLDLPGIKVCAPRDKKRNEMATGLENNLQKQCVIGESCDLTFTDFTRKYHFINISLLFICCSYFWLLLVQQVWTSNLISSVDRWTWTIHYIVGLY